MMKSRLAGLFAMCLPLVTLAGATMEEIDALRWQNRLLLVFATPGTGDAIASLEARFAEYQCELDDRDVVIMRVAVNADAVRKRYQVPPEQSAVLLIGKDGGVKLRDGADVNLDLVFDRIDGMPMRRLEMRERASTC